MWDEITVSLANELIESLEIESPQTRKTMQNVQLYGFQGGIIDFELTAPLPPKNTPGPGMWDEITVSLTNESIESLEIESPRTREMDLGTNFPAVHPAFQLNIGNVKLRAFNVWKKEDKIFVNTIIL